MPEISLPQGTTGFTTTLHAIDTTTGRGGVIDTGVIATIELFYCRQGEGPQAITLSELSAIDDPWETGGILAYDATGTSGAHRLDIPDEALEPGADYVVIFGQDADIDVLPITIMLDQRIEATLSGTPTTTSAVTNLTETTDDHYVGRGVVFKGGALDGQTTRITAYNGTTKAITYAALTEAPSAGQKFVLF